MLVTPRVLEWLLDSLGRIGGWFCHLGFHVFGRLAGRTLIPGRGAGWPGAAFGCLTPVVSLLFMSSFSIRLAVRAVADVQKNVNEL